MLKFYKDVSLYGLAICFFIGVMSSGISTTFGEWLLRNLIIFGVFGTGLGFLGFNYFQKQQFYMYNNLGYSKTFLFLRSWAVNFGISMILILLVSIFL